MAEVPQQVQIGDIRFPEYLRPTYSNFIQVNHTPWDFRLVFAVVRTPTPGELPQRAAGGIEEVEIHPEAVVDIIFPANLVHGLISALRTQFERYIEAFGAPGLNPEGPSGGE